MSNATVLVVDDEPLIRWSLVNRLKQEGYRTLEAGTASDAVAQHRDGADLVLLDVALPDANGLDGAQADQGDRSRHAGDHADRATGVETAVEAMKHGAFHYANKPFDLDEVMLLVEKALETTHLRREVRALRARAGAALRPGEHRRRERRRSSRCGRCCRRSASARRRRCC